MIRRKDDSSKQESLAFNADPSTDPILRHQRNNDDKARRRFNRKMTSFVTSSFHKKVLFIGGGIFLLGIHLYLLGVLLSAAPQPTADFFPSNSNAIRKASEEPRLLTELGPRDREQYTVRINTWQRHDQLAVSLAHHASCEGAAQIQVIWCEKEDPPEELLQIYPGKILFERHDVNSLNERFHILPDSHTQTLGILSIDDDVLRPCEAIDSGFFQWTRSPSRMVGFDYRVHVVNEDGSWKYGYLSTTQKGNRYSMSLPRYSFIHRDYLDWYMEYLPRPIFSHVAESFNCEDIAMSFFISSLTDGRPPLLAHFWAIETMIKLYSPKKISGTKQHKALRDVCVDSFAEQLDLKDRLYAAPILHRNDTMFYCGDQHYECANYPYSNHHKTNNLRGVDEVEQQETSSLPARQVSHEKATDQWRTKGKKEIAHIIAHMKSKTSARAKLAGLIENTEEWKARFETK